MCSDDEIVSYTCAVFTTEVQWIIEPFIPATGVDEVYLVNFESLLGLVVRRNGMVFKHVSFNPFFTTLTINASVIDSSANVTCSTSGFSPKRASTLPYLLNDGMYQLKREENNSWPCTHTIQ